MVAQLRNHEAWRRQGCDERCVVKRVFLPGLSGREPLECHDPDAHEAYGRATAGVPTDAIETGRLSINLERSQVHVDGKTVWLTPVETRILAYLARRLDSVCLYQDIVIASYGEEWLLSPQATAHRLRVDLSRIRTKLGLDGWALRTHCGLGLRLERLPVGEIASAPGGYLTKKKGRWAREWDACQICGSTSRPHNGHGVCNLRSCRVRFNAQQRCDIESIGGSP